MKLIVGLGNPGKQYEKTRHNVGFMVLDALAASFGGTETTVHGEKVILLKPQTFMNNSGEAVQKLANFHKPDPADIWVISDDLDLPLGKIRVRESGSTGGHNGLKSIEEKLGTQDYYRIRVGIGPTMFTQDDPGANKLDATVYVLQPFEPRELKLLDKTLAVVAALIEQAIKLQELKRHTLTIDSAGLS